MVTFVLTAFVIYFAIVKPDNLYMARHQKDEPETQTTEEILVQIRDLLSDRRGV